MSLEVELGLRKPVALLAHEALLNTYYTASCLKKKAGLFLRPFGLTDVQFNLMMLLQQQSSSEEGLTQAQLSDMMLVNRANITSLIDRMEKGGLVARTSTPADRRYNIVKLTDRGKDLLTQIEPLYAQEVKRIMAALADSEKKKFIKMLERVRCNINGKKAHQNTGA
ncbi:MAG: MarR family winged helix-turn-helix transcriptional regulator [Planctomycetota bacterium]|jgi:DNA-binding MarR family transcriptional regulator